MKKRGTDYSPAPSLSAALLSLADRLEQTGKAPLEKPCEIDAVSSREAPQVEELQPPHNLCGFRCWQSALGRDQGYPIAQGLIMFSPLFLVRIHAAPAFPSSAVASAIVWRKALIQVIVACESPQVTLGVFPFDVLRHIGAVIPHLDLDVSNRRVDAGGRGRCGGDQVDAGFLQQRSRVTIR